MFFMVGLLIIVLLILKRKFIKQWWSRIPPILFNKTYNHLSPHISEHEQNTTTYGVRNPGPGLGQTQTCGGVKPNGSNL